MEEEKVADDSRARSTSPLPPGLPVDRGLIKGPVQPVLAAPPLSGQLPPPQSSTVHALQTKVKSLTQRRTRARDREKERNVEVSASSPAWQVSPGALRQRPAGKGQFSWRSGAAKLLSSSDEEEEVEVQVRLEIHSPPADARGELVFLEGKDTEVERSDGRPCGLQEGTSLESLLSDNCSSSKDGLSPPPPLHTLSSSASATTSSSTSSTSARHWAPPKGFWRVARPETLLLNGMGPGSMHSSLLLRDYTQTEASAAPQRKSKPAEASCRSDVGSTADASRAWSDLRHSDSVESFLDRCEQREAQDKGLCSSDSWESVSSQSGAPSAGDGLKVKHWAYAKLRDGQPNSWEEREQGGGESAGHLEDVTYRGDCKGGSHVDGGGWSHK